MTAKMVMVAIRSNDPEGGLAKKEEETTADRRVLRCLRSKTEWVLRTRVAVKPMWRRKNSTTGWKLTAAARPDPDIRLLAAGFPRIGEG